MNDTNKSLVEQRKQQIIETFTKPENLDRLLPYFNGDKNKADKFKQSLMMIAMDSKLQQCAPMSVYKAGLSCAEIGLNPQSSLKQVWFVSYWNKNIKQFECQFQIGKMGWIALSERAGKIVKAHNVYKCDVFSYKVLGFEEAVEFIPDFTKRTESDSKWVNENLLGTIVMIRDSVQKVDIVKFVKKDKLDQIKMMNQSVKKGNYSPWTDWAAEMYDAKAIKYVLSKTSTDEKTHLAIEVENKLHLLNNGMIDQPKKISPLEADLTGDTMLPEPESEPEDDDHKNPYLTDERLSDQNEDESK